TTTQSEKSAPATTTKSPLITTTTVDPSKMAPAAKPDGPTNAELYKQQEMFIRRLDSLSDRLNQVLDQLDQQASQAAKPWWHFWEK
ncbi:hypothetical protein, partial [Clostridioides difficile]|uniref:hypothetical protein n=1 Tax=Clostridioides difficile TaxID=1496 RepID=UPI0021147FCD